VDEEVAGEVAEASSGVFCDGHDEGR
jgi:hypothetical protein